MAGGVHVIDDESTWVCDGDPNSPEEVERRREWARKQRAKQELPPPEAEVAVKAAKAEGDAALKGAAGLRPPQARKQLEAAEASYGKAMKVLPSSWGPESTLTADIAALLANRALVRLKLAALSPLFSAEKAYKSCVDDCRAALDLKPDYPKALYRRARAHLALACKPYGTPGSAEQRALLDACEADLARVLELDPDNTEAALWRKAAPLLAAEFEGHRLPDALQEARTLAAAIDARAAAPAGGAAAAWPAEVRAILLKGRPTAGGGSGSASGGGGVPDKGPAAPARGARDAADGAATAVPLWRRSWERATASQWAAAASAVAAAAVVAAVLAKRAIAATPAM